MRVHFAGQDTRFPGKMTLSCAVLGAALSCAILADCVSSENSRAADPSERGWVDREIFQTPPYRAFTVGYDSARIAPEFVQMIRQVQQGIDVTVFFGAWCSDSKREVPRFLKIADSAHMESTHIRFYALDRTKKSSDGLTERYAIERVPTFIFLKNGEEVGRITEAPKTTLEADMLTILAEAQRR